jgi:hypothetical protein
VRRALLVLLLLGLPCRATAEGRAVPPPAANVAPRAPAANVAPRAPAANVAPLAPRPPIHRLHRLYRHAYGVEVGVSPARTVFTITTPEDHDLYVEGHRLRIDLIAKELVRQNPDRYAHVDLARLHHAALSHDQMKVERDPAVLRRFGFVEPPRQTLVRLWGRPLSTLSGPLAGDEGADFVTKLTRADHALEKGMTAEEIELINLADKIDKGSDPVAHFEELGRTGRAASEYLRNPQHPEYDPVKSPQLADMAERVERVLGVVVPAHLGTLSLLEQRRPGPPAERR